ncbi:MAG: hypothetical protein ACPKPY_00920 [Nitrososphaeraceae archaeon]
MFSNKDSPFRTLQILMKTSRGQEVLNIMINTFIETNNLNTTIHKTVDVAQRNEIIPIIALSALVDLCNLLYKGHRESE